MRTTLLALCVLVLPVSCHSLSREQQSSLKAAHQRYAAVPSTVTRRQAQVQLGPATRSHDKQTLVWETTADPVNFERLAARFEGKGAAKSMVWVTSEGDNRGLYRHQKIEARKSETGQPPFLWKRRLGLRFAAPPTNDALVDESDLWP